jgi:hypothetical protein
MGAGSRAGGQTGARGSPARVLRKRAPGAWCVQLKGRWYYGQPARNVDDRLCQGRCNRGGAGRRPPAL